MGSTTENFGLKRLGAGDNLSENGYQFTDADRVTIDRLLAQTLGHRHDGTSSGGLATPSVALTLTQNNTVGSIPAGTRIYYRYSLVDASGGESAANPEKFIDTPLPVETPAAPILITSNTGGTLLPGNYYYVVSAYTTVNTQETKATNPAYITVPAGTSTNRITVNFPTKPAGATGFNIYRLKAGGANYVYLASSTGTSFIDNGSIAEDCNRFPAVVNSTNGTNSIIVTISNNTVPVGMTWRLYRTFAVGSYINSLLHWIVEETAEGSGIITPTFTDFGEATSASTPRETSQTVVYPAKVQLEDSAEVQGRLPLGAVSAFPVVVEFHRSGQVALSVGKGAYMCEFPRATIKGVRASLGRGSSPQGQPLIVDVNRGTNVAVPVYSTIFTTQTNRPQVLVGQQRGNRVLPDLVELVEGESLTVDVDQLGTSGTEGDLTVTIYLWVYGFGLISHDWV